MNEFLSDESIIHRIHLIRGFKVMLDSDPAEMYGVPTKRLNEQVKRNIERFPSDFMFQLTEKEVKNLQSQFATSSWGGRRNPPYVFTEHGVLMLSSVLTSPTAVQVNIKIIRVYTKLGEILLSNKDILLKLERLENQVSKNSEEIRVIFTALRQLLNPAPEPRKRIGFRRKDEE
jgi:hypothetical protein